VLLAGDYDLLVKSRIGQWKGHVTVREKDVVEVNAVTREPYAGQCERLDETRGAEMCFVPAGSFDAGCATRGAVSCVKGEQEVHAAWVGAFWMDRTEVTVSEYANCMKSGRCPAPAPGAQCNQGKAGRGEHPVNCVGLDGARAYCGWAGKRLPTEEEWEKAARGEDGRIYPWGDSPPSCRLAVMVQGGAGCGKDSTWSVGSKPAGGSPYGMRDMAGNVWEWATNGRGAALRGGSWVDAPGLMRSSLRLPDVPTRGFANTGFRCAADAR